jgi:hypothetical protein
LRDTLYGRFSLKPTGVADTIDTLVTQQRRNVVLRRRISDAAVQPFVTARTRLGAENSELNGGTSGFIPQDN